MVYVVIPAYNEAGHIGTVITGLQQAGFNALIVVDDGSSDTTYDESIKAGATVLRHVLNRGQGAALQTGVAYALRRGAEYVIHFDGDNQFDPADIAPALEALKLSKADVLLGSRFLGAPSNLPVLKRYLLLPLSRWINFVFTGVLLSDGQNGFRVMTRRAAEKIAIAHDGMAHNIEIVAQIKKEKLTHIEFPVTVTYHRYGQGIRSGFKIIRDLLLAPWVS